MKMSHEKLMLLKYTPRLWESLQKWIKVQSVQIASNPLFHMFTTFTLCHTYTIIRQFSRVRNVHIIRRWCRRKGCVRGFSFCSGQITHSSDTTYILLEKFSIMGVKLKVLWREKCWVWMKQIYNYLIIVFWPYWHALPWNCEKSKASPKHCRGVCISDNPVGMR